ncbi:MAG: hypothetical protein H5T59_07840 [Anaerolineae bacterium]|nr:hypothetical protein [Anaerolineae bacterium]
MSRRSYALAFLVILIIFCLGAYVGISTFVMALPKLEALLSRAAAPTPTAVSQAPATVPLVTPTAPTIPTPQPPTPTPVPPTPTSPPATPTPEGPPTPTPTPRPSPTSTSPPYLFVPAGPVRHDAEQACFANYIRGTVRDAQGNPLEGVRIYAYDQWGNEAFATSKGGADLGQWDIVIGGTPDVWHVVVVDGEGNALSPVVDVPHHQEGPDKAACWHWLDWQRTR